MMSIRIVCCLFVLILVQGCGSSSSESAPKQDTPIQNIIPDKVTVEIVVAEAIEQNRQAAKIRISRDKIGTSLAINYQLNNHQDSSLGQASAEDFLILYEDGTEVGTHIQFYAQQSYRIIELFPLEDDLFEVPEWLSFELLPNSNIELKASSALISIIDAPNNEANAKVFYSTFSPQEDAATSASGVLSFILSGDNSHGHLNYSFSDLSSEQTDQHIHLAPSGIAVKDIDKRGNIENFLWDLSASGIYTTKQAMLDALFRGEFYVNIHTGNYPHGEILARLLYDENVTPPEQNPLSENDIDRDIVRFLNQATFGSTPESYQELREQISRDGSNSLQVYSDWIDNQIALEQSSLLALTDALMPHFSGESPEKVRRDAFWTMATFSKDQLRQKTAFALSQILVISDELNSIRKAYKGAAHYWDMLAEQSFGQYNLLLKDVTLSPVMGVWLSHIRNKKEDPEKGYFPDENYAREIMQLFSFGLIHQQKNGTVKLGENNLPTPTYDNEVIKALARVFTGLSYSVKAQSGTAVTNYKFEIGDWVNDYQYRWLEPLRFFPEHHDFNEKNLFLDQGTTVTIPASNAYTSEAAMDELTLVIDAIVSHSSTAPFIARQLIQRFVTSNPSPDYIERVAMAFGETGDLEATIKAVLLDPEARNPNIYLNSKAGKYKEPAVQLVHTLRLFNAHSQIPLGEGENGLKLPMASSFEQDATLLRLSDLDIGQRALGADSVFNFYQADYAPAGEISKQSLVAPEMQLLTEAQIYTTLNVYDRLAYWGVFRGSAVNNSLYEKDELKVLPTFHALKALWQQTNGTKKDKISAVINFVDFHLNAGVLSKDPALKSQPQLTDWLAELEQEQVFKELIYTVNSLPEFLIQL